MAVVSTDHAAESLSAAGLEPLGPRMPRIITPAELKRNNEGVRANPRGVAFWAVVDGWVVDASAFVDAHPGGLKKLLSTDEASIGATGKQYGFSFSRGRNAHFPKTGQSFSAGVKRYLSGGGVEGSCDGPFLPPCAVQFETYGSIVILGKLGHE